MKAIIRPEKFQLLRKALSQAGVGGLTITEAAGTGKQKGQEGSFRGNYFHMELLPKIKVETVVTEQQVDDIIEVILTHYHTGNVGDGKISVSQVEEAIRIRTGKKGKESVQ
ncbi:P-II family nitrogen regulator [Virgibacillus pantothenticus]|uniref:P-II family nitrogen regulator n=1 Tax=Virgibacillus pantothenticus TaxID=1473 RepID=UPI003D293122